MRTLQTAALALVLVAAQQPPAERNPGKLRMALVNLKCRFSDGPDEAANRAAVQANLARHLYFIDKAVAEGADFVGFPELSLNGYRYSKTLLWLKRDGPEIGALAEKAREKKIYIAAGIAEAAPDGRKWNTHVVLGPDGKIVGFQNKIWLTGEKGHTEKGSEHRVFDVKGMKMGISICADGTDYRNVKGLVDNGAQIIYGPHANTTGSTIAGWYRFRARWGGIWDGKTVMAPTSNDGPPAEVPSGGWIGQLKVYAALHNHAALYSPDFNPPTANDANTRWASGAWFIGPDGRTLAQMPTSTDRAASKEFLLIHDIPLPAAPK
jgi:predicted amidohydrolase